MDPEYLSQVQEYIYQIGVYLEENGHHDPDSSVLMKVILQRFPKPPRLVGQPLLRLIDVAEQNNVRVCGLEETGSPAAVYIDGGRVIRIGLYSPGPENT